MTLAAGSRNPSNARHQRCQARPVFFGYGGKLQAQAIPGFYVPHRCIRTQLAFLNQEVKIYG